MGYSPFFPFSFVQAAIFPANSSDQKATHRKVTSQKTAVCLWPKFQVPWQLTEKVASAELFLPLLRLESFKSQYDTSLLQFLYFRLYQLGDSLSQKGPKDLIISYISGINLKHDLHLFCPFNDFFFFQIKTSSLLLISIPNHFCSIAKKKLQLKGTKQENSP